MSAVKFTVIDLHGRRHEFGDGLEWRVDRNDTLIVSVHSDRRMVAMFTSPDAVIDTGATIDRSAELPEVAALKIRLGDELAEHAVTQARVSNGEVAHAVTQARLKNQIRQADELRASAAQDRAQLLTAEGQIRELEARLRNAPMRLPKGWAIEKTGQGRYVVVQRHPDMTTARFVVVDSDDMMALFVRDLLEVVGQPVAQQELQK